jgi:hypothetical protein
MLGLVEEARLFRAEKSAETTEARQRAALSLCCGIDLDQLEKADPASRSALAVRIRRAIERERLKGTRLHWSYDLNRHIALKQALDRLCPPDPARRPKTVRVAGRHRRPGRLTKTAPEGAVFHLD